VTWHQVVRRWLTAPLIVAVAFAVALVVSSPSPAGATEPGVGIDPTSGPPLTTIKVDGQGFCGPPCSPVSIVIGTLHVDDSVPVGSDGTFRVFVQVPGAVRSGQAPVIVSTTDADGNTISARTDFDVTPSRPAPTIYPPPASIQPPGGGPAGTQPPATRPPVTGPTPGSEPIPGPTTETTIVGPTSRPPKPAPASASRHTDSDNRDRVVLAVALLGALGIGAAVWWRRRH